MAAYGQTATTQSSPERVWATWSDTSTWKSWNPSVVDMTIDGPFAAGTNGVMTTRERGAHAVRIVAVESQKSFTLDSAGLPGSRFIFQCSVEPLAGGGSTIGQSVSMTRPLAGIWGRVMGKQIAKWFSPILAGLARYVDGGSSAQTP